MKSEYEKHRERLTQREREEVWRGILERSGGGRVRVGLLPRLVLVAGGAMAVVLLIFLVRPHQTPERLPASPPAVAENRALPQDLGPLGREAKRAPMKPAAPGGEHPSVVTSATPAVPSRVAAEPQRKTGGSDLLAEKKGIEKGEITGTVRDSTGKPLAYANVIVVGTSLGAMTDDAGRFRIRKIPAGAYTVKAVVLGYAESATRVEVGGDLAIATDFTLQQKAPAKGDMAEVTMNRWVKRTEPVGLRESVKTQSIRNLPTDGSTPATGGTAGIVAQGGELHSRGGRAVEQTWGGVARRPSPSPAPPVLPTTGGSTLPNDQVYDSMYFEHYGVNPFIPTDEDSLSTFAVDVDAASYTVARRYIDLGHLPPKEAVRVEEFVNYFRQDYPDFTDTDFRILVEGAPSAFRKGYGLLRIGLKARVVEDRDRRPANLTFVIDCSGSMHREDRLELVKQALHVLIGRLRPDDTIGIVTYQTSGQVLLEPTSVDAQNGDLGELRDDRNTGRGRILDAIDRLRPDGSTNAEEGLRLGYDMARAHFRSDAINRIVLCTDGVANEGVTGADAILERVRREADKGIDLTAIGFGMGNYNDVLLEQLADKGDGNYYYVDRLDEAERIFVEKLTGTIQTIAKDAKVQVQFDPRLVLRYRLLGFENRDVADRDFRNNKVDAGEIGAGHAVTALYEIKLADRVESGPIATVRLRYARPPQDADGAPDVREIESTFDAADLRSSVDRASPRFRLDAAVAEFAEILRRSFWAKEHRIADVLPLARRAAEEMRDDPDVREFARIVEKAADLSDKLTPEERKAIEIYDTPWEHSRPTRPSGDRK